MQAATYDVGAGQAYPTIAGLPTLQPGDVVNIHCGIYNEVRQWLASGTAASPITLQGVCTTGRPVIDGTNQDTSGDGGQPRGDWEFQGSYYIIRNLEFRNARNGDNAAGIRVFNTNITIINCLMDNNDMGLLTSTGNVDNLVVQNSEIAYNGAGDDQSHNVYITAGNNVTFSYCYIHDSTSGENFKTRAHYTQLLYNLIAFGAESEVEGIDSANTVGPNSNMTMIGNILVSMPVRTVNETKFVIFGQDTGGPHNGTLYLINNTLIAGSSEIGFLRSSASNSSIVAVNNIFYGSDTIIQPGWGSGITGSNNWMPSTASIPPGFINNVTGLDPGFINAALQDFAVTAASGTRNTGIPNPTYTDGNGVVHSGVPTQQYVQPLSSSPRPVDTGMDLGAYGFAVTATGTPDLTIASHHTENFVQGRNGIYSLTVTNSGTSNTVGTVAVTDLVPAGMTAVGISGTGWICTLAPLGCSRSDVIGPGFSFQPILLTVSVAATAPGSLTNAAAVLGGGEVNVANDTATDPTIITTPALAPDAASFLKSDLTTTGTWRATYGTDGYNVFGDVGVYPSYVSVTPAGVMPWTWTDTTTDPRALQMISVPGGRIASCLYSSTSFTFDLQFQDTNPHQVALYLLDWDNLAGGRSERIDILDGNGNMLDTRTVVSFQGGQYLVWKLTGHITIRVTNNNPSSNAVVSGIFFDALLTGGPSTGAATFVKADTTTGGGWKGIYGTEGENVISDSTVYPSYVSVSPQANSAWVWDGSPSDSRALLRVNSTFNRIAACWYSAGVFTLAFNFNDTGIHQVALYMVDWDNLGNGRSQRVDVLDSNGNLLDTRTVSGFQAGQYLVWKLSGHIVVRITNANPNANAVISGIFFGAPITPTQAVNTAAFVATDMTTQGSWRGVYGSDGVNVIGDAAAYPSYVSVTPSAYMAWTWAGSTSDVRALQMQSSTSGRIASCIYSSGTFSIDFTFTDANTHQVALYMVDWDNYYGRSQQVDVLDPNGNVLDSRSVTGFIGGKYLVWNLSGHVIIHITNTNPMSNAVVSGIFFGTSNTTQTVQSNTVSFLKADTTTQGSWRGVYGADGGNVMGDAAAYPTYVHVTPGSNMAWTWASPTSDVRAPQLESLLTGRIASCWYSTASFTIDLAFTDTNSHQVALYMVDWDNYFGRTQRVDVLDPNGNILDTRNVSGFLGGQYLVWNLSGHVTLRITNTNPMSNAVVSGIFFR